MCNKVHKDPAPHFQGHPQHHPHHPQLGILGEYSPQLPASGHPSDAHKIFDAVPQLKQALLWVSGIVSPPGLGAAANNNNNAWHRSAVQYSVQCGSAAKNSKSRIMR